MVYRIEVTESARVDLEHFEVYEQRMIIAGTFVQLTRDPEQETKRKKRLRENPISPWELRIDKYRVFYSIEPEQTVKILAVGHKEHNMLFIRGKEVEL